LKRLLDGGQSPPASISRQGFANKSLQSSATFQSCTALIRKQVPETESASGTCLYVLFDFQSKTASMQFCFVGYGESVLSPCLRNASHSAAVASRKTAMPFNGCRFGATSCRAIPFPDQK
jgi:hypothetical protein